MARTHKLKVIIEVDVTEEDHIVPRMSRQHSGGASNLAVEMPDPSPTDQPHTQTLLTALQADPDRHAEFIKILAIYSLDILGVNEGFAGLAQLHDSYTASLQVLRDLIPYLPPAAQAHFQPFIDEDLLSEGTMAVYDALQVTPVSLRVEYPGTPA